MGPKHSTVEVELPVSIPVSVSAPLPTLIRLPAIDLSPEPHAKSVFLSANGVGQSDSSKDEEIEFLRIRVRALEETLRQGRPAGKPKRRQK